jgi:hypothetical protein
LDCEETARKQLKCSHSDVDSDTEDAGSENQPDSHMSLVLAESIAMCRPMMTTTTSEQNISIVEFLIPGIDMSTIGLSNILSELPLPTKSIRFACPFFKHDPKIYRT